MSTLIVLGVVLFIFVGFIFVLRLEAYRGVRFFAESRTRFDQFAGHMGFIATHVDFSAFTWQLLKDSGMHLLHIVLHLLLLGIRFIERLLTRTVRGIRVQKAEAEEDSLKTTSTLLKKVHSRALRMIRPKKAASPESLDSQE